MKISIYNQKAEVVGEIDLNAKIFGIKATQHLLAEAVRIQQNNARQGSSHTKTRGEVSGGGKKPWKQKGTGRARAGSIRSPIWRHGGVSFGPRSNRNWELKMNKKAKTKALFMSLSDKIQNNRILVIDRIVMDKAKTKDFVLMLKDFQTTMKDMGKKLMVVTPKKDDNISRATRNIQSIQTTLASSLNIVDVLKADAVMIMKDSLPVIEKTYLKIADKKQEARI